jgi:hypothetical protein
MMEVLGALHTCSAIVWSSVWNLSTPGG